MAPPTLIPAQPNIGIPLSGGAIGPLAVMNSNSMAVADDPSDPYYTLAGSDTAAGNVYRVAVPSGAAYLCMSHEFHGASSVATPPVVRAYGKLAVQPNAATPVAGGVSASFYSPSGTDGQWVLLGNMNTGAYRITLGSAGEAETMYVGQTSYRSLPSTVHLRGCSEVIVVIDTAASGITGGVVVATMEMADA